MGGANKKRYRHHTQERPDGHPVLVGLGAVTAPEVDSLIGGQIRQSWLFEVCSFLQRLILELSCESESPHLPPAAVQGIPLPRTRLEELALGGLLLEVACGGRGMTSAQLRSRLIQLAKISRSGRGLTIAERAALHISLNYSKALAIADLTAKLGCDGTRLRRKFMSEYGMCLREYHLRTRVQAALSIMSNERTKVSSVSAAVGYSNDKNFYRAIHRYTGKTPGELRALGHSELRQIASEMLPAPQKQNCCDQG